MGMGDVKLAGVIGLMVGYPLVLPALLGGIILGGLAAALLLITKRATRKTAIAYAPYLCVGALAVPAWLAEDIGTGDAGEVHDEENRSGWSMRARGRRSRPARVSPTTPGPASRG